MISLLRTLEFGRFLAYPDMVMGRKIIIFLFFMALLPVSGTWAQDAVKAAPPQETLAVDTARTSSGLPIPRYVSLASEKVFVRTGPALRYPIRWVYQREYMPVEIIQEFDTWRKIRDIDGDDGWVYQAMLSGKRTAIVKGEVNLFIRKEPSLESKPVAYLEPGVVADISECAAEWCQIAADGYTGWAERKFLWGIYDEEDFD